MSDGVAVDANIMSQFRQDMLTKHQSLCGLLVERIISDHGLAIDYGGKIQHEWFTQCPDALFKEWFAQNMKLGRIRMVRAVVSQEHKRALFNDLGFPKRGYDIVYIGVANVTQKKYIVTDDLDFFDPKHKKSDHKTREKIKQERNCTVCAYLRKQMNITVGNPWHATTDLVFSKHDEKPTLPPSGDAQ